MKTSEYSSYDGIGIAQLIKSKQIKPEEALQAAIELAREYNPKLNAVTQWFESKACDLLRRANPQAPLYGVPCLLKDLNFSLEGTRDTRGAHLFAENVSSDNDDYVTAMLEAGLIPFGKTNTPEFGLSSDTYSYLHGLCLNPLDEKAMVGGSSGGSAAAVASGIVPIATGSDGGGSIRVPAACCGLFGFKPSPGLTPDGPNYAEQWAGLASSHVLTRSIRDSALMLDLTCTNKAQNNCYLHASGQFPSALKVAMFTQAPHTVDPIMLQAVETMGQRLSLYGHACEPIDLALNFDAIGQSVIHLISANIASGLSEYSEKRLTDELHPFSLEFYRIGMNLSAVDVIQARNALYRLTQPIRDCFNRYDVILTPTLAQSPLASGQLFEITQFSQYLNANAAFSPFTGLFNQAGVPAMTLPLIHKTHSIPVSLQFAAGWGGDATLFKLANQLFDV